MILQKEIAEIAEKQQVSKSTIDKDWVLGHLLNGLFLEEVCQKQWVFKGGTCLRKCYLENYRFSEDLDFTITEEVYSFEQDFLQSVLDKVSAQTGVLFSVKELKPMLSENKPTGYKAVVKFWGADHPKNQVPPAPERWQTSIKLELIQYEKMVFETQKRKIFHQYSDATLIVAEVPCYHIHEVLAEKLRALIQRRYTAPRDYYDIWFLSRYFTDLDWVSIVQAFHQKMEYKNLVFEDIEQMIRIKDQKRFKKDWENNLKNHLAAHQLPDFDAVLMDIRSLLENIFE